MCKMIIGKNIHWQIMFLLFLANVGIFHWLLWLLDWYCALTGFFTCLPAITPIPSNDWLMKGCASCIAMCVVCVCVCICVCLCGVHASGCVCAMCNYCPEFIVQQTSGLRVATKAQRRGQETSLGEGREARESRESARRTQRKPSIL